LRACPLSAIMFSRIGCVFGQDCYKQWNVGVHTRVPYSWVASH
jgi:hypothetical protein